MENFKEKVSEFYNPGDIDDFYDFDEDNLGEGAFSVVKKAYRISDGKAFAVKAIDKDCLGEEEMQKLMTELYILTYVNL